MAQVDKGTFERLRAQAAGAAGWSDAAPGGRRAGAADARGRREPPRRSPTSVLRLDEVPRGMLVAVAVLAVVAVVLGVLLAARVTGGGELLVRGDAASESLPGASPGESVDTAGEQGADGAGALAEGADTADEVAAELYVHVTGAVVAPGVYGLPEGARVVDAVAAAGGVVEDADQEALNLAAPLVDGAKVRVPFTGEDAAGAGGEVTEGSVVAQDGGLVNINTADAVELQRLPGVGEATAAAIIAEREAGGPFASVDDLVRVDGIGEKKLAKMRVLATV